MDMWKPRIQPRLRYEGAYSLAEMLRTIVFVLAVTVLFDMAIPRSLVDGRSMQPTFEDGERLIVSRLHYMIEHPDRGDVLVFNSLSPHEPDVMLIKRVIGLPGELIEFRNQQLYINGQLIEEPYILEACREGRCPDESWRLGRDQYFMMGDNRNNSHDSRAFGPVSIDHIVGRVIFRYWPMNRIGLVQHRDYPEMLP
jgi:signal peptidase I